MAPDPALERERLPIKDASAHMGVSIDTVRRHLRQGKLSGEFVDGKWLVDLPPPAAARQDGSGVPSQTVIAMLQQQLEYRHEEMLGLQNLIDRLLGERAPRK